MTTYTYIISTITIAHVYLVLLVYHLFQHQTISSEKFQFVSNSNEYKHKGKEKTAYSLVT